MRKLNHIIYLLFFLDIIYILVKTDKTNPQYFLNNENNIVLVLLILVLTILCCIILRISEKKYSYNRLIKKSLVLLFVIILFLNIFSFRKFNIQNANWAISKKETVHLFNSILYNPGDWAKYHGQVYAFINYYLRDKNIYTSQDDFVTKDDYIDVAFSKKILKMDKQVINHEVVMNLFEFIRFSKEGEYPDIYFQVENPEKQSSDIYVVFDNEGAQYYLYESAYKKVLKRGIK